MSDSQPSPLASSPAFPVIGITGLPCSGKSRAAELLAAGKVPRFGPGRLFQADNAGHDVLERPEVKARLRAHFGRQALTAATPDSGIEPGGAEPKRQGFQPYQAGQSGWTDQSGRFIQPQCQPGKRSGNTPSSTLPDDPVEFRKALAGLVFSNPDNLAWLESVVHPLVVSDTDAVLNEEQGKRPVLIEAALLFAANMDTRCDRIILVEADFAVRLKRAARRGWSREELQRRETRQVPLFTSARERDTAGRIRIVPNNGSIDDLIQALQKALGSSSP